MPNPEVPLPKSIKLLRAPIGAVIGRAPMKPGMLHTQLEALGHGATLARHSPPIPGCPLTASGTYAGRRELRRPRMAGLTSVPEEPS